MKYIGHRKIIEKMGCDRENLQRVLDRGNMVLGGSYVRLEKTERGEVLKGYVGCSGVFIAGLREVGGMREVEVLSGFFETEPTVGMEVFLASRRFYKEVQRLKEKRESVYEYIVRNTERIEGADQMGGYVLLKGKIKEGEQE